MTSRHGLRLAIAGALALAACGDDPRPGAPDAEPGYELPTTDIIDDLAPGPLDAVETVDDVQPDVSYDVPDALEDAADALDDVPDALEDAADALEDVAADVPDDTASPDAGDTEPPPPAPLPGWRLTLDDDFDGPPTPGDPCYDAAKTPPMCLDRYWSRAPCPPEVADALADLNKCRWSVYDIYNWMDWNKPWGTGINKLDATQVEVSDGELRLKATKASGAGPWSCGGELPDYYVAEECPIRSGAIMSRAWDGTPGFQQQYGRFEVRAILPAGPGAWPAHWMLPQDGGWPDAGEIDIMEAIWEHPTEAHATFHGGTVDGETRTHYSRGHHHDPGDARFTTTWHTYAVEWRPGEIRFFFDDLEVGRVWDGLMLDATIIGSADPEQLGAAVGPLPLEVPASPFFFILNTSIVPTGGLKQDLSNFQPMVHRIDRVRAFEPCTTDQDGCAPATAGHRVLTREPWMTGGKWSEQYRVAHAADFDGDGRADLLLQGKSAAHATYLLRATDGTTFAPELTLSEPPGLPAGQWSHDDHALTVGDFDGDGRADVLLRARGATGDSFLLLADGNGAFKAPQVVTWAFDMTADKWDAAQRDPVVADFDGDGADDLLLVPRDPGAAFLLRGGQPAGLGDLANVTYFFGLDDALWADAAVHAGDFDGDGRADLLLLPATAEGSARLLRATEDGLFAEAQVLTGAFDLPAAAWSTAASVPHLADFDGDGRADLLLQPKTAAGATWLLRGAADPAAPFLDAWQLDGAFGVDTATWAASGRRLVAGDFNGDGAADLFLQALTPAGATRLLLTNGAGAFQAAVTLGNAGPFGPHHLAADQHEALPADFDGDGRAELVLRGRLTTVDTYLYRPAP